MKHILPIIVIAQFLCTSLWFAGNAVLSDVVKVLQVEEHFLAHLTSAVQIGFITGTLVFAVLMFADRYAPSKVFFFSSILAAAFNLGVVIQGIHSTELLFFRFMTGFFLAGIYPVGMKIASDYYQAGLGKSLGFLVGALVLGTAFPHLVKGMTLGVDWTYVIYGTSVLCIVGGLLVLLFIPDGPFRKAGQKLNLSQFLQGFRIQKFRSAALGYFGHMWEVYTFWAFVPVMLGVYNSVYPEANFNVALYSFLIIASGGPACVIGGVLSQKFGAGKTAATFLALSCMCCFLSPFFLLNPSPIVFIFFLFIWGITVVPDSPLFSSLVAQSAPEMVRGSSITIVTCIGFSITIVSIQLISMLSNTISPQYVYMVMAIGPVLGLFAIIGQSRQQQVR